MLHTEIGIISDFFFQNPHLQSVIYYAPTRATQLKLGNQPFPPVCGLIGAYYGTNNRFGVTPTITYQSVLIHITNQTSVHLVSFFLFFSFFLGYPLTIFKNHVLPCF